MSTPPESLTRTGVSDCSAVLPKPSWPRELSPQQFTVPSALTVHANRLPTEIRGRCVRALSSMRAGRGNGCSARQKNQQAGTDCSHGKSPLSRARPRAGFILGAELWLAVSCAGMIDSATHTSDRECVLWQRGNSVKPIDDMRATRLQPTRVLNGRDEAKGVRYVTLLAH